MSKMQHDWYQAVLKGEGILKSGATYLTPERRVQRGKHKSWVNIYLYVGCSIAVILFPHWRETRFVWWDIPAKR